MVRKLLLILVFLGLSYLIFSHRQRIPAVASPVVTSIHISPQMVVNATLNYRNRLSLPALKTREDLCLLGDGILVTLKSQWQTGVFESVSKNFYLLHPEYSNLSMQAAVINLDTSEKINAWLETSGIKKEVESPDYNSICAVTDGSYVVQILGKYNPPPKNIPLSTKPPVISSDTGPWGVSKQINEHTWSIKVGEDNVMATPAELFTALNIYRRRYGSQILNWDQKLADYAQSRAVYINQLKNTDDHQGFIDFLNNRDGFNKLGFTTLGENIMYGYRLSGVHIIEWVYAGDEPHNSNQLDNKWNYVGIGISGLGNSIIFGTGRR